MSHLVTPQLLSFVLSEVTSHKFVDHFWFLIFMDMLIVVVCSLWRLSGTTVRDHHRNFPCKIILSCVIAFKKKLFINAST